MEIIQKCKNRPGDYLCGMMFIPSSKSVKLNIDILTFLDMKKEMLCYDLIFLKNIIQMMFIAQLLPNVKKKRMQKHQYLKWLNWT